MTLRNSGDFATEILEEQGVRQFSLVGGARAHRLISWAIDRAREDDRQRQAVGRTIRASREQRKPETIRFVEGQWDLDFDEDSGDEAWWIELQLLDKESGAHLATLTLSDVEAHGLVDAMLKMISEGRERFR